MVITPLNNRVIQWACVILEVIHRWRRLEAKISRLFHVMWLSFNQYNWFFIMWGIIISVNVLWPYWSVFEIVIWILIISKSLQSSKLIFSKLMIGMPVLYYKVRALPFGKPHEKLRKRQKKTNQPQILKNKYLFVIINKVWQVIHL
jgi:hypothetical protein